MIGAESHDRNRWSERVENGIILLGALGAVVINLLLLAQRISAGAAGIAGCGGGSCDDVLASRWASIFGVPVTVFGLLVYVGLVISWIMRARRVQETLLGVVVGAAFWFIFVQIFLLGKFCPWCMAAHGIALGMASIRILAANRDNRMAQLLKRMAISAAIAISATALTQCFGPIPASYRIELFTLSVREHRRATFDGGAKSFDVEALPHCGPVKAEHVMVEYFDYQCAACRTMAGYLDGLLAKYPEKIAVVLLPMPLDESCNGYIQTKNQHPGSCEMARIALAVWRVKPEAFLVWHRAVIADPSPATARRLALEIIPEHRLTTALADPWIDDLIHSNIADWRRLSVSTEKLPKLLVSDRRILHGLPSSLVDFTRVMEHELGL